MGEINVRGVKSSNQVVKIDLKILFARVIQTLTYCQSESDFCNADREMKNWSVFKLNRINFESRSVIFVMKIRCPLRGRGKQGQKHPKRNRRFLGAKSRFFRLNDQMTNDKTSFFCCQYNLICLTFSVGSVTVEYFLPTQ